MYKSMIRIVLDSFFLWRKHKNLFLGKSFSITFAMLDITAHSIYEDYRPLIALKCMNSAMEYKWMNIPVIFFIIISPFPTLHSNATNTSRLYFTNIHVFQIHCWRDRKIGRYSACIVPNVSVRIKCINV